MLGKFKEWPDWVLPLLSHSAVHGAATYVIAYCVRPDTALWLALFDLSTHFIVDRIKASPSLGGRFKALSSDEYKFWAKSKAAFVPLRDKFEGDENAQKSYQVYKGMVEAIDRRFKDNFYFWLFLGLDQAAHHLCHYFIIWQLVR